MKNENLKILMVYGYQGTKQSCISICTERYQHLHIYKKGFTEDSFKLVRKYSRVNQCVVYQRLGQQYELIN